MSTKISPQLIKELRERTGVGMSKCSQALKNAEGDIELAISNLRKAGLASAVKKEGRETNEGSIGYYESDKAVVIIEINSETDFVAQNENFKKFLSEMTKEIAETKPSSVDDFLKQPYSADPSLTIDEYRGVIIQQLGENIQIRRFVFFDKKDNHSFGLYSHMQGKILCYVDIAGSSKEVDLARDIGMHIAAESPDYLDVNDIPQNIIDHEKDIAKSQMKGKPENIIDKIIAGKMRAFHDQVCLKKQKFVKNIDVSIEKLIENKGKETGTNLKIENFLRWQLGS